MLSKDAKQWIVRHIEAMPSELRRRPAAEQQLLEFEASYGQIPEDYRWFLLACGAPLQHASGLVDGMRIGEDVFPSWAGIQAPARAAALRSFYHRSVWLNDPDCLVVRPPLALEEARVWASVVAVSGGMTILSDNLPKLPAERLPLLPTTLPVARTLQPAHDLDRLLDALHRMDGQPFERARIAVA